MTDKTPLHPRLHIAIDCGLYERTIFSLDGGCYINAGCFWGSPDLLKRRITEKYTEESDGRYLDSYLAAVDECVEGWEPGSDEYNALVTHRHWHVRQQVARQGHGLDKLVDDDYWHVRMEVAHQAYGLDKLVDDPTWQVRRAVVSVGYGLDKLINDPSLTVQCHARVMKERMQ